MNRSAWLSFCSIFLLTLSAFGQVKPGTYASVNSFEKVCLRLGDDQKFAFFSSNCTTDRDFSGRWQVRGDTLVLNSDNGPAMELGKVLENPTAEFAHGEALAVEKPDGKDNAGTIKIMLRSADAPLLRSLRVSMGDASAFPNSSGVVYHALPLDTIYFNMEGMKPSNYVPMNPMAAAFDVEIRFKNLDKPSLFNDRWLLSGRKLSYLPGPGSSRSAEIGLVRGKRCFYKMPKP